MDVRIAGTGLPGRTTFLVLVVFGFFDGRANAGTPGARDPEVAGPVGAGSVPDLG